MEMQVSGMQLYNKEIRHRCRPVNFTKFLRILFYRAPPVDCGKSDFSDLQLAANGISEIIPFRKVYWQKSRGVFRTLSNI